MRTAIYCRLSEEDRNKKQENDDSESIQNQKNMLLHYAMEQGWEIYDIYSDDDYTGANRNRPAFNRLLRDAESKKFDIILCKTQSRFTRELEIVEKYIHGLFPLWGIRFVSIVDHADTDNKTNKKSRQINALVNEWYLEDMSAGIKSVLDHKRQNGIHIGSFALYGYQKDPDKKGHLIIDEEAASVVREVFTLFAKGYGKTAIARMLNHREIPNPTEYKRLKGISYKAPPSKNGTLWRYSAISAMLTNEMYIGNMVQGRYGSISYKSKKNHPRPKSEWYIVKGTHEPIIDLELWNTVQNMIAMKTKPHATGSIGIFAGKVHCMNCGYVMRSSKNRGKYYLRCATRYASKDACAGAFISVESLEKIVLTELQRLTDTYLDKDALAKNINNSHNYDKQKRKCLTDLEIYRKKLAEYKRGLHALYLDKIKGVLTDEDFIELSNNFSAEKKCLENRISQAEKELSALDEKGGSDDDRGTLIERYIHIDHLTHEIVSEMIDHIRVGKRPQAAQDVPIEIHWNF